MQVFRGLLSLKFAAKRVPSIQFGVHKEHIIHQELSPKRIPSFDSTSHSNKIAIDTNRMGMIVPKIRPIRLTQFEIQTINTGGYCAETKAKPILLK